MGSTFDQLVLRGGGLSLKLALDLRRHHSAVQLVVLFESLFILACLLRELIQVAKLVSVLKFFLVRLAL